jgi:hypothetical protein
MRPYLILYGLVGLATAAITGPFDDLVRLAIFTVTGLVIGFAVTSIIKMFSAKK